MANKLMEKQRAKQQADETPTDKKLEELYGLVEGIDIAMMTTRRADGHLVSRPMQTQGHEDIADFWYVTDVEAHKLDELEHDPHVNLSFYKDRTREWVSVSGTARISQDRAMIRRLYKPDWKAYFKNEDGEGGGPDDPRIALVLVDAHSVSYLKQDKPRPVILFEVAKAIVTKSTPNVGEVKQLRGDELR